MGIIIAMVFETVFDISKSGINNWQMLLIPLLLTVLGALLVFAPNFMQKILSDGVQGKARHIFSYFYFGFALFMTILWIWSVGSEYYKSITAFGSGKYKIVEGRVTDFVPMPYEGHADERFRVNGVPFSYSDYSITCGFNNSASHGGPISEGLYVRISYVGNIILKLEIAKN